MAARQRRRKSHRLYALIVIILGIAILVIGFCLLFYVQKLEVKGNEYTDSQEITELVQEDPLSVNSVYLLVKYRFLNPEIPGNLSSMSVSLKNPWTVKITVKEKTIVGYAAESSGYAFFDENGTVVLKSSELAVKVPGVEGLSISDATLYKKLKVGSKKVLKAVLNTAQEVRDFDLEPDRIVYEDGGISLYFGDICVKLGTDVTTEKMAQITPILAKLTGKAGTLHLEHYESSSNTITFAEDTGTSDSTQDSQEAGSTAQDTSGDSSAAEDVSGESAGQDTAESSYDGYDSYEGYDSTADGTSDSAAYGDSETE